MRGPDASIAAPENAAILSETEPSLSETEPSLSQFEWLPRNYCGGAMSFHWSYIVSAAVTELSLLAARELSSARSASVSARRFLFALTSA